MDDDDGATLPISLVAHWQFCPRRAWLEAVGERSLSEQLEIGLAAHARADDPKSAAPGEYRAIEVRHRAWGLTGRLDVVEDADGSLIVREFKATPVRRRTEVTDAMRVQLALQRACLEDMGYSVSGTEIFFTTHHRRVSVELDDQDLAAAQHAVEATRSVVESETAPEPLEDSARCSRCSHAGVCLPDERGLGRVTRRATASDPDSQVVYLTTPGSRAFKSRGRLEVHKDGERLASLPLEQIQALQVHGNIDLSSALLRELLWMNVPVLWCSGTGRLYGWAVPGSGPNGLHRVAQHVASHEGRLALAREFVASKIANQATQLRRGGGTTATVEVLRRIQRKASTANTWQDVIGREGEAAALYFAEFELLVREPLRSSWPWAGRSGRPATDSLNAALNYVYGMLTGDAVRAIVSCGLDPHAGFLHSSGRNKPALALDLMEEFRAPVADSVVVGAVNNGELKPEDFIELMGTVRMKDRARKQLTAAYERRMTTSFRHPVFGYDVTWRRALEVQARQVLGVLDGSQSAYRGVRTR